MRLLLGALFLLTVTSSYGKLLVDPADIQNEGYAQYACSKLGKLCTKYKETECNFSLTPMPNTCLAIRYFEIEVAKERCGSNKYLECDNTNRKYAKKWMNKLNIPNIGNPKRNIAFKKCEHVGMYNVKSKQLEKYAENIYEVFKYVRKPIKDLKPPYYRIYKEYYECFKENL